MSCAKAEILIGVKKRKKAQELLFSFIKKYSDDYTVCLRSMNEDEISAIHAKKGFYISVHSDNENKLDMFLAAFCLFCKKRDVFLSFMPEVWVLSSSSSWF